MACSVPASPYAWKNCVRLTPDPDPPQRPLLLPHAASPPAAARPMAARRTVRRSQLLLLNADMLTSLSRDAAAALAAQRQTAQKGGAERDVNLRLRLRQGVERSLHEALYPVRDVERGSGATRERWTGSSRTG